MYSIYLDIVVCIIYISIHLLDIHVWLPLSSPPQMDVESDNSPPVAEVSPPRVIVQAPIPQRAEVCVYNKDLFMHFWIIFPLHMSLTVSEFTNAKLPRKKVRNISILPGL